MVCCLFCFPDGAPSPAPVRFVRRTVGSFEVGDVEMSEDRVIRARTPDGVEIVARAIGEGPPVVLLPAGPGDSETSWGPVVPGLADYFTCYHVNTRGRGLSADHPNHEPSCLVNDVSATVNEIDEPVCLMGWGTALWSYIAAERPEIVSAIVAYEPGADEVMTEEVGAGMAEAFARAGSLVAEDRMEDAASAFIEMSDVIYPKRDLESGTPSEFWMTSASNIPLLLQEEMLVAESKQPGPTSPATLAQIEAPVLLLLGSESSDWFADSVRHVAQHVAEAEIREILGAGHFGPITHPNAVASEVKQFLATVSPRRN
jgi:pimeloyl-ACP methyl ester carboxylesterase